MNCSQQMGAEKNLKSVLMKRKFTRHLFNGFIVLLVFSIKTHAQCAAGYTAAELNWDNIDFLPSNNTRYTTFYPNAAFPYEQNFAIGTRRLNMIMAPQANITLGGENGINTAHTGSLAAAGDDIHFITTSSNATTISMTFDVNVANVMFSLFDIDSTQRVTITALNAANVAQNITLVRANGTSGITITGSGTATAVAAAPAASYADNDNRGTVNVTVAGPVNRIVLTFDTRVGNFWLSDIDACVTGTFPNNYQQISRPFTGQPQYVLTVVNNNIYYTDPTNGRSYHLFYEPGHDRLNSMAYDPYRRIVYYTYSLTDRYGLDPRVDKTLKKYDVDSKTISVVIPDVNTFGIPTYESGVESGAATFYNGSLYLGIEGYTGENYAASRKSTIWKIDFDAAGNPVAPATQVWGILADNGVQSQNIHDWSDFGITNGMLIDFDGSGSGDYDVYHTNLMTGVTTNYIPVPGWIPRQTSIGWDERLYDVNAAISLYNNTTGIGTSFTMVAPLGPTIPTGNAASWGDAAGPYRPFLDFGDAPATYDPDPWSPACHDTLTPTLMGVRRRLRLGPDEDVEWLKRGLTSVEDNYEDGLSFIPIFSPISNSYTAQVSVMNNTNQNATLCAWLDYNGNGYFDAAESITPITVPSAAGAQSYFLTWPSITSPLLTGATTYLRIRITYASYGMNASRSTGYYDVGEVEDYRIFVDNMVLGIPLLSFDAGVKNNSKVELEWSINEESDYMCYTAERSKDGNTWEQVAFVPAQGAGSHQYQIDDNNPYTGKSYYRLRLNDMDGPVRYSLIRTVKIEDLSAFISVYPNPASDKLTINISEITNEHVQVKMVTAAGNIVHQQKIMLSHYPGHSIEIPFKSSWQPGIYFVQVTIGTEVVNKKIVIKK